MINIALVSACDRNNYGDVLLPALLDRYINEKLPDHAFDIKYYGLTEADLTSVGGAKVRPLAEISDDTDIVVMSRSVVVLRKLLRSFLILFRMRFWLAGTSWRRSFISVVIPLLGFLLFGRRTGLICLRESWRRLRRCGFLGFMKTFAGKGF